MFVGGYVCGVFYVIGYWWDIEYVVEYVGGVVGFYCF